MASVNLPAEHLACSDGPDEATPGRGAEAESCGVIGAVVDLHVSVVPRHVDACLLLASGAAPPPTRAVVLHETLLRVNPDRRAAGSARQWKFHDSGTLHLRFMSSVRQAVFLDIPRSGALVSSISADKDFWI